jgi:uroporphyrinogen-III decarboxylase
MPRGGWYFDDVAFNRGGTIDPAAFRPQSDIPDESLRLMESYARGLYRDTAYALLGWGFGVCFLGLSLITDRSSNVTQGLPDEWMMMLLTEKETCHEMMDRSVEATINCLRLVHEALGDCCFAWGIASDDSGTQRCEFIHPDLWAEMMKPHYAKLCAWIHAHTRMKTFLHSCGSIPNLIPHWIEAGVDILNPVQTSAAGMDPRVLKDRYGRRIVFWGGGCDTQTVLPRGTPDEVREHVKDRLSIFAPGGGYVFTQVHNVQAKVPVENVEAMLGAAHEFGVAVSR